MCVPLFCHENPPIKLSPSGSGLIECISSSNAAIKLIRLPLDWFMLFNRIERALLHPSTNVRTIVHRNIAAYIPAVHHCLVGELNINTVIFECIAVRVRAHTVLYLQYRLKY